MSSLCGIVVASEHADFGYLINISVEDEDGDDIGKGLSISGSIEGSYEPSSGVDIECNLSVSPPFHYDTGDYEKIIVSANAYLISPGGKIIGKEGPTYTKVVNITDSEIPCSGEICLLD